MQNITSASKFSFISPVDIPKLICEYFCLNLSYKSFVSAFIGEQYIHQIHNNENPTILSYKMVLELIQNVNRSIFINFVKKIFTFGNINIVYQGKRRIPNLPILVQQRI